MAVAAVKKMPAGIVTGKNIVKKDASKFAKKPHIFTTVEGGRLHVGVDEHYTGSVSSYNNFFTKFFAKVFGWSKEITVNSKVRHVNKTDYAKWLNNNTAQAEVSASELTGYLDVNSLELRPSDTQGHMRDHISASKARKLFEKMVRALVEKRDEEAAIKYAGKGADLDREFWIREGFGLSFEGVDANLPENKAVDFKAWRFTPLLYAQEMRRFSFSDFLMRCNTNSFAVGQEVQFTRRIMEVNPHTTIDESEDYVTDDGRLVTRVRMKTVTMLQFEDQLSPKVDLAYSPEEGSLLRVESKAATVIEKYTKKDVRYTTRYL